MRVIPGPVVGGSPFSDASRCMNIMKRLCKTVRTYVQLSLTWHEIAFSMRDLVLHLFFVLSTFLIVTIRGFSRIFATLETELVEARTEVRKIYMIYGGPVPSPIHRV